MHDELRERVLEANLVLAELDLAHLSYGNVSEIDRDAGVVAIKPSGVPYDDLRADDVALVTLDGERLGGLKPSSDTPTHLELYRAFVSCGGIVHTHSEYATTFAQSRTCVRCMGTTHADYFRGDVPCTRPLTRAEVETDYERNTGLVIVETFRAAALDPEQMTAVLVANHGPFTWGRDAADAVEHARVLEYLARVEWRVRALAPDAPPPERYLVDKHYLRKHGPKAYYGQK